jgi:hypothetical protein
MKKIKKLFLLIGLGATVGVTLTSLTNRSEMKLIHKTTRFVVAETDNKSIIIKDPFLEKELKLKGIKIPPVLKDQFEGKAVVKMGDPLFAKAFKEIYLKLNMGESSYEWKEESASS